MDSLRGFTIANARITHNKARVPLIENIAFKDRKGALAEIRSMVDVDECVLLQTCNRVELYAVSKDGEAICKMLSEYLVKRAGDMVKEAYKSVEVSFDQDALKHILRIASGLESMIVGEDQVLGQVWNAYLEAESAGTTGPVLKTLFNKAVNVGRRVRNETNISKGAVSIGSAAVELAESLLGTLDGKKVLVIGAGEMGTLVAKALARRHLNAIFVANRTHNRALKLAEELCGKAVKFDRLEEALIDADVVICSTSAPHYLLTKELIHKIMKQHHSRSDLVIIDISTPRNVDEFVKEIEGVKLYDLDDLQKIAERNKEERQKSAEKASKIVEEELIPLDQDLKALSVENVVSFLLSRAEEVRQKELMMALNMLESIDEKERQIIDDLTRILVKRIFMPLVSNLRIAATINDRQLVDIATRLFKMEGS